MRISYAASPRLVGSKGRYLRMPFYKPDWLARHCLDNVLALVAGKDTNPLSTIRRCWTSLSGDVDNSPVAVRNPNVFTGSYDLTGVSVFRTGQPASKFPHCLITPLHTIGSHVSIALGDKISFVSNTNIVHIRTVVACVNFTSDIYITKLDSPLPTDIQPMLLSPKDLKRWFDGADAVLPGSTSPAGRSYCPVVAMHGNWANGAGSQGLMSIDTVSSLLFESLSTGSMRVHGDGLEAWSQLVISGDSNGPVMLPVNGRLVLLATFDNTLTQGLRAGPFTINKNTTLASIGEQEVYPEELIARIGSSGFMPTRADFSMFNTVY